MITSGGRRFDFIKFFFIFLVWIIGSWFIIYNVNLADREGFVMFDGKSYIKAQNGKLMEEIDINTEIPETETNKK